MATSVVAEEAKGAGTEATSARVSSPGGNLTGSEPGPGMGATSEATKVASVIMEGADTKATLARLGSGGVIRLEPSPEAGMGLTVS